MQIIEITILRYKIAFVAVIAFIFLPACSTFQVIEIPDSLDGKIHVNDKVRVDTINGDQQTIIVSGVTSDKLESHENAITLNDIKSLEKNVFSPEKTALLSGLVTGAIVLNPIIGISISIVSYVALKVIY